MNNTIQAQRGGAVALGLLLAVGLIIGGWALGAEIKAARLGDRYVSVRGLAERDVKSDLAIWTLQYAVGGDELSLLYPKAEANKKVILEFLRKQGLQDSEIQIGMVSVADNLQQSGRGKTQFRYSVNQQITVATSRVDEVAAASQKTMELLQQGVVLGGNEWNQQGIVYKFNGLNAIKPDMITEATRNARAAAQRFADDAGSGLGSIRQATQGIFAILPAKSGMASDEEGGGSNQADSSLMKTIRVVTTVDYFLK